MSFVGGAISFAPDPTPFFLPVPARRAPAARVEAEAAFRPVGAAFLAVPRFGAFRVVVERLAMPLVAGFDCFRSAGAALRLRAATPFLRRSAIDGPPSRRTPLTGSARPRL